MYHQAMQSDALTPAPGLAHTRAVDLNRTIILTPRPPFDPAPILGYYGRSPLEPLDHVVKGAWRRAVRLDGQMVLFEAAPSGTIDAPSVIVRLLAPALVQTQVSAPAPPALAAESSAPAIAEAPALLVHVAGAVARWWRLDQDASELATIAAGDPVFGELLARLHGARSPLMPSPFECLVWAILGQQITVAFAYKMKRALVERYGDALEHAGQTYRLFPDAARLAAADPADLREIQFSRQKSDYIRGLAALVAEDRIDWDALAMMPSADAIKELTALRGVGRWTAEYVLMRGLGHPDVIPAGDVALQAAIGRAYGLGRKATEPEVRAYAERWTPHRSHASFAWWWSLSTKAP
jgi:DNA-3-methyladenine glycosylase II